MEQRCRESDKEFRAQEEFKFVFLCILDVSFFLQKFHTLDGGERLDVTWEGRSLDQKNYYKRTFQERGEVWARFHAFHCLHRDFGHAVSKLKPDGIVFEDFDEHEIKC